MKQRIFTLLFALVCLATSSWAYDYDVEIDGIYYKLSYAGWNNYATVSNGPKAYTGKMEIPQSFTYNNKKYDVTDIEYGAFRGCSSLTSLNIPNSVTEIGNDAFRGCSSLTSLNIPNSVTRIGNNAFSGCSSLISINLPDGVTRIIGEGCFNGCSSLTSLNIPDGVTSIGNNAFSGCSNLSSLNIPDGVTSIGNNAFSGCSNLSSLNIPDGVTSIEYRTFYCCSSLTSINLPDGVTSIAKESFYGCNSLSSINIPDGVTSIGDYAFKDCNSLSSINIPDGVTSIGDYAFSGCNSLSSINIPNGITTITTKMLSGCSGLISIHIPASVTSIDNGAFQECTQLKAIDVARDNANYCSADDILYNKELTTLLCYPAGKSNNATFIIPTNVTKIENYAFANCKGITSIIVPSTVETINSAFFYCSLKHLCLWGKLDNYSGVNSSLPASSIIYCDKSEIDKIKKYHPNTEALRFYYPSKVQSKFRTISFTLARSELLEVEPYTSVSLTSVKFGDTEITPDENGRYTVSGLNPDTPYGITVTCKMSDGKDFIFTQTERTKKPSITISCTGCTQTTMTFTVNAESDETCVLTGKGVYVEYEGSYYCTGDKVVLRGLKPNGSYVIAPIAEYGGTRLSGEEEWYTTASMKPSVIANVGPTSISVSGSYEKGDAHVSETGFTDQGTGNSLVLTGLTPNTSYTVEYYVKTEEGGYEKAKRTFTTSNLQLTTLQPRCVSSTCAIVAAETNMGDDEINAGFQWRKYDAPDELKSSEGYAAIYNGQLEGYIKNLQSSSYYYVRAFYKSAEGEYYYGGWVMFDPSDFSYFEPTVHTYAATDVTHNSVRVKGYVLAGTENIDEQGFEYWPANGSATNALRVQATTKAAVSDVQTVLAQGQVMTAELRDLQPETTYCCRAFVRTATGTVYGEEQTFTTEADLTGVDNIVTEEAAAPTVTGYYDMLGRKSVTPHHGVNIVRYSNGTTRKVFMK